MSLVCSIGHRVSSSLLSSLLVGTVTELLLIFEPDNLERDLELKQAFSRQFIRVFDIDGAISACFIS